LFGDGLRRLAWELEVLDAAEWTALLEVREMLEGVGEMMCDGAEEGLGVGILANTASELE
jgi:hypothetical protein